MSDDYLCLTVRSNPNEEAAAFKSRLSTFWTGMLRNQPDEFEKVYAETVKFATAGDRLTRQYLFETVIADLLEKQLADAGIDYAALDRDDTYTKYEAAPPEWMWIEH